MKVRFIYLWLRFFTWLSCKIGLYRSVRETMFYGKRDLHDLRMELDLLCMISRSPIADLWYMDRMIKIKTSARILEALKLLWPESKPVPTSEVSKLKEIVEKSIGVTIEETELGYRYYNNKVCTWSMMCSEENKRRLELLSMVLNVR